MSSNRFHESNECHQSVSLINSITASVKTKCNQSESMIEAQLRSLIKSVNDSMDIIKSSSQRMLSSWGKITDCGNAQYVTNRLKTNARRKQKSLTFSNTQKQEHSNNKHSSPRSPPKIMTRSQLRRSGNILVTPQRKSMKKKNLSPPAPTSPPVKGVKMQKKSIPSPFSESNISNTILDSSIFKCTNQFLQ